MTQTSDTRGAILLDIRSSVAWITFSNPTKHNALSTAMMAQLDQTLRELGGDSSVRAVVLRGEGSDAFAAGADISEFESQQNVDEVRQQNSDAVSSLFLGLSESATPVVAMISGYCLGAGVALSMAADIRIASTTSTFAIPAARLGIGYPVALTNALARTVGPGNAAEILFTGKRIDARRAHSMGLVNDVVPPEELETAVTAMTSAIAENAPMSIRAAKASIAVGADPGRAAIAQSYVDACADSNDFREGQAAFMAKRAPRFTGV